MQHEQNPSLQNGENILENRDKKCLIILSI